MPVFSTWKAVFHESTYTLSLSSSPKAQIKSRALNADLFAVGMVDINWNTIMMLDGSFIIYFYNDAKTLAELSPVNIGNGNESSYIPIAAEITVNGFRIETKAEAYANYIIFDAADGRYILQNLYNGNSVDIETYYQGKTFLASFDCKDFKETIDANMDKFTYDQWRIYTEDNLMSCTNIRKADNSTSSAIILIGMGESYDTGIDSIIIYGLQPATELFWRWEPYSHLRIDFDNGRTMHVDSNEDLFRIQRVKTIRSNLRDSDTVVFTLTLSGGDTINVTYSSSELDTYFTFPYHFAY